MTSGVYGHYGCGSDHLENQTYHQNLNVKPRLTAPFKSNAATTKHKSSLRGRNQNPSAANLHTYENIRLHFDTSALEQQWQGYSKKSYFIDDVLPAARDWIQNVISVRPVDGALTFTAPCYKQYTSGDNYGKCKQLSATWNTCGDTGAVIADDMFDELEICPTSDPSLCETTSHPQGRGMNETDLLIYITGDPSRDDSKDCTGVMGFAAFCETDAFNRPIAGYINLCRSTIEATEVLTWEEVISLIIHESMHVLGFSSDGFSNFVDADGVPLSSDQVWRSVFKRGKKRTMIVLPTVVEKAREFFGCETLEGVELEDHNIAIGYPSSHWDNRVVLYDVMISYVPPAASFSSFTLAVLADSGWYEIDWKYAQQASYGRQRGCEWTDSPCIVNGEPLDDTAFCSDSVKYSCSSSYVGKFYCGLSMWNTELPSAMQYFGDPILGGDNVYPDFCPLFEEYSNGDCRLYGDHNIGTSDENTGDLGGLITGASKCALIEGETNGVGAGCFPTHCLKNAQGEYVGTRLTIYRNYLHTVFDVMTCWAYESGQAKRFPYGYNANKNFGFNTIYCPEFTDICYDENPWICNGHGTIHNGTCVCSPGYFGRDCTIEANKANRELYSDADSVSRYVDTVCNGGEWNYDVYSDANVGILNVQIIGVSDADYVEAYMMEALKNWIAVLTDISQCDVELNAFVYHRNSSEISTDLYYYSSLKTWSDVSDSEAQWTFDSLFPASARLTVIEEKPSTGWHVDNFNRASTICIGWPILVIGFVVIQFA
eukprot:CAMPEP_0202694016 /NCGR_PEP_ID=MMETSP1385-20130828/7978_1 /ASSEMBLY_ACC=CAM_ASM_000861 /TAXON_ID=933848 /ORGANISM="Elphidium margaritaceum" /LENGTH=768 /DNA_ID=CAMNT_0049349791 /DNA_START=73 /DNA_END=2379 /DNA_ORIENTATION=-